MGKKYTMDVNRTNVLFEGRAMHKAYRFRLYPTRTQAKLLNETIGC